MSKKMTSHERFRRMFAHEEADRIPVMDSPWNATVERWRREGMPAGVSYVDFFDLDTTGWIATDNSPRYPVRTVEETDTYKIHTSPWGVTMKSWKQAASTPEFLDFTIRDPDSWRAAKARMTPSRDRVNWDNLKANYATWKRAGHWIQAGLWFGFDITHSWAVGTERVLMAIAEDPEWCVDMFRTELDLHLALLDMVWEAGYRFDQVAWPDDMGYKLHQFFSVATYRELIKPFHKRAVEWAHAHGVKAELHSCGDIRPFVPELVEIGMDGLNPLEVKAGMDPIALKREFGGRLLLHGGINAVLWDRPDEIRAEMERVIPAMKQGGGYVFSSDHSVPSSVSLEDFRRIIGWAKELGSYA